MKITFKTKKPDNYKVGQIIQLLDSPNAGLYLLAQVDTKEINLISLNDGNRLNEPINVKDVNKISLSDLHLLTITPNIAVREAELIIS